MPELRKLYYLDNEGAFQVVPSDTWDIGRVVSGMVTEGDYSTYAEVRRTTPLKSGSDYIGYIDMHNEMSDAYAYVGAGDLAVIKLSDASFNYIVDGCDWFYPRSGCKSISGKYMAVRDAEAKYINVYKEGVLIASLPVDNLAEDYWMGVLISPSGRYVVAVHRDWSQPTVDENTAVIFEGS